MTAADYILEKLRQLSPCKASEIETEVFIDNNRGVLEGGERGAVGHVVSLLRHWERLGLAKFDGAEWHWVAEVKPMKASQKSLF